jgi:hypothetical protein
LTLIFYARKHQIKVYKHCTTVQCAYAYHYVLLAHVHNLSANRQLNWKIPEQVSRGEGGTPDISHILMFYWFEPVLYLDPVSTFQYSETTERPGYFVGFADNVGDALTFKILKNELITVLHRSVVRSAADASHRNRRVSFKSDVNESFKLLDTKPSLSIVLER